MHITNWRETTTSHFVDGLGCKSGSALPDAQLDDIQAGCPTGLRHVRHQHACLSARVLTLGLLMGTGPGQQGLTRRRASPAACRAGASGSDRFTSFVLNITVWRLLSLAGSPLRQIVSWYIFTGRSCWALAVDLQRWLWRAVGWLSAPPRSAALQRFGSPLLDVRRWHYGLGGTSASWRPLIRLIPGYNGAALAAEPHTVPPWLHDAQQLDLRWCYRRLPCQHLSCSARLHRGCGCIDACSQFALYCKAVRADARHNLSGQQDDSDLQPGH
jgi:hypothetical protein